MVPFLKKYCKQGGAIPSPNFLRDHYLREIGADLRNEITAKIQNSVARNQSMSLIVDESTDNSERHVLNFVLRCRSDNYLLNSVVLQDPPYHHNVATEIINAMVKNNISSSVRFLVTDNAEYCKKAFTDILSSLYPKMVWIGCWAHIINLCGNAWLGHFTATKKFLILVKKAFKKKVGAARRARFTRFLRQCAVPNIKVPPTIKFTRWTSAMNAAIYHAQFFEFYKDFFNMEYSKLDALYLNEICELLNHQETTLQIKFELQFISETAKKNN